MAIIQKLRIALLAAAVGSAVFVTDAFACACCSETGQRLEQTQELDSYSRGELLNVRFAENARLYLDAGFPDTVEGVQDPLDQDYKLNVIRNPSEWIFEFTDSKNRKGSIIFPLPKKFTRFEVDPRGIDQAPGGHGPALYKEWRLSGISKLSGTLAAKGVWATSRLVLHGEGNSCTSAADFRNWTLSVLGKNIRFRFLGLTVR